MNMPECMHNVNNLKDLGLIVSAYFNWPQLITSRAYKMLGLLRRVFSSSVALPAKRSLYTSLVRSQLLYCSQIWHPYLLVDVKAIELVQRRATKFIVNNTSIDYSYRNQLIHFKLLPLMMELEIADRMFLIKSMRSPTDHFNIYNFVEFSSCPTRSCSNFKLKHSISRTKMEGNFYFNRILRLWNSLPTLDANLSVSTIKYKLRKYFWDYFIAHFDPNDECSFHYLCLCQKCSTLPVNMHLGNSSI